MDSHPIMGRRLSLRARPYRLLWSIPWILLNGALSGLLGGMLLWGPLNASLTATLVAGSVVTVGATALWVLQERAVWRGEIAHARCMRRWLLGVPLSIVALSMLVALVQLYTMGSLMPRGGDRVAEFERLWRALDRHYVYFDYKGVDWDAVYARYHPQVVAAEDDTAYFSAIYDMLAELQDGHTALQTPNVAFEGIHIFGFTGEMAGQAVVLRAGELAQAAGLEEGAVLLEVDGEPVEAVLDRWLAYIPQGSSPWHHRRRAYLHLLATFEDSLSVTFEDPNGEVRSAVLRWDPEVGMAGLGSEQTPPITFQRLPSGVGVIRITDFNMGRGWGLVQEFDAALDTMLDAPGIIIDVRGHNGGFSVLGDMMAGRLFEEGFEYARTHFRTRLPQHAWRRWMAFRVIPRGVTYTGPVVLLINHSTYSSGEAFAVALADSGRAYVIGRRTAGATGNPVPFLLQGGRARYSTGDFRRNDGSHLEGVGVAPDLTVEWTVTAFRAGIDPDIEAAEAYLRPAAPWHVPPWHVPLSQQSDRD